ncbi:MAG TPA: tetratricopeptide repeat protein, partial [Planctomycetota bacterium]|nr:tetratricopeptide repeat protein [Planctomycetota bacterium]
PAKSPFSFAGAESDSALGRYVILLKLEEGIALAGTGEAKKGLDVIHAVIAEQEARGESGAPFVTDARVALAKIESAGLAGLTGRELYQVALGKLSQSRGKPELIEEALRAFQRAIMTLDPADITTYAPRCLDQIGQLHYMLGRYEEAALVFREIVEFFPSSEDIGKAATNYLASVNLARNARSEHGVLATMFDEGQKFVARFGDGDSFPELQARMAEAQRARDEGRYSEAAEIYGSVPRERDGKKVPFYFRARFSSWWMHVLDFESNASEEAKARFAEAIADIEGSLEEALAEKDLLGAAVGSFAVGQMRFHLDEHAKAVEALSIFLDGGALEEDTYVRCEALGYLVGSAAQVDDSKA